MKAGGIVGNEVFHFVFIFIVFNVEHFVGFAMVQKHHKAAFVSKWP
jgi:hypothetical protein